jgi:hypothetical protein
MTVADITGAPYAGFTNIAWSREGRNLTLSWEYTASDATAEDNPYRVDRVRFTTGYLYNESGVIIGWTHKNAAEIMLRADQSSYTFDLTNMDIREDAGYSYHDICKIEGGYLIPGNSFGYNYAKKTPYFYLYPATAPEAEIDYNYSTGEITFTLTGSEAVMSRPRACYHMTISKVTYTNNVLSNSSSVWNSDVLDWDDTDTLTYSKTITEKQTELNKIDDYICYTFEASAIGLGGKTYKTTKILYIAYPAKPHISYFTKVSSGSNNVRVLSDYSAQRPTETLQLQIQYANSPANLTEAGWSDVGEEYDCQRLMTLPINDSDIQPTVGMHVYLRVCAKAQGREVYSDAYQVLDSLYYWQEDYYTDADASVIEIEEVKQGGDSESLEVLIGYASDENYDACLLTYSTDQRAWTSTNQPEEFEMPDSRWMSLTSESKTGHACTSRITVLGLESDTVYWLRARRYKTTDSTKNTRFSAKAKCNTSQEELTGLTLTASDIVATGKECAFTWSFPEDWKQTSWTLKDASTNVGLKNATSSATSTTYTFTSAGTKTVYLEIVLDSGRTTQSDPVTVTVVDAPTLAFTTAPTSTLTTLPQTFSIKSTNNASANIQVKVLCENGVKAVKPDGKTEQYVNDIIYSAQGTGSVDCSIVDGSKLWNGGRYRIQAVATANGVKSSPLEACFSVSYSSKPITPTASDVVITPAGKTATVTVRNLATGITWDLYRATVDGRNALIAQDLASGATVTDNFAPYSSNGSNEYNVLVKNSQQQYTFAPYEYTLKSGVLRFDWNNNSVELPYNIEISDEVDKQFEQQVYLDGTQRGSWGASVIRSATLSTDTIYIKDEAVQQKVRELARYQGAVFVRTPLGQAYCANVDVKDISKAYDSNIMAVEFECTEIDLTSEYGATVDAS